MADIKKKKKIKSLKSKALLFISVMITFFGIASAITLSYKIYNDLKSEIRMRFELITQMQADALAGPVWDYNNQQIDSLLKAFSRDPDFLGAAIFDVDSNLMNSYGKIGQQDNTLQVQRDISFVQGEETKVLGRLVVYISLERVDRIFMSQFEVSAIVIMAMMILILFTVYKAFRMFTVPMEKLETVMFDLARGNNDIVVPFTQRLDEIGKIANVIDIFRRNNIELIDAKKSMEAAKLYAESSNKAKSEFISNISHELRNPMHAILNYSGMGVERLEQKSFDEVKNYLFKVKKSGYRLLNLLNALLDLSKMEAGLMDFNFSSYNMKKAIVESMEEIKPLASSKNIKLSLEASEEEYKCEFDYGRIIQLIINILSNAVKFTPDGKAIIVEIKHIEELLPINNFAEKVNAISIEIKDEGCGIDEGEIDTIFDKFIQSSKTRISGGGTGLGLAISKAIIEAHNGKIWAENNLDTGSGAKFTFVIPCISGKELI